MPRPSHEVPIYGGLPTEYTAPAAPPYPAFPGHHDATSIEHTIASSLNANVAPAISQSLSPSIQHHVSSTHVPSTTLHLDPQLPPEPPAPPVPHRHLTTETVIIQHVPIQPPPRGGQIMSVQDEPEPTLPTSPPPIPPNSAPEGEWDMAPPPESMHTSFTALLDYAQTHAAAHGYALSINTTSKNRSRIKLACVCYGSPKNTHRLTTETRIRKNRVSSKTGCRMWIEGKRMDTGLWRLRIGIANHNHPGRGPEGWAVQRKRTWGLESGRVGVGGITAKEERERLAREALMGQAQPVNDSTDQMDGVGQADGQQNGTTADQQNESGSLESGGLVWRIVEQEMMKKGGGQGRDRGVGRTVQVLQERFPGIRIFKRDVYNIRAQIKRSRRRAGQEIGEGLQFDDEDEAATPDQEQQHPPGGASQGHTQQGVQTRQTTRQANSNNQAYPQIDPMLVDAAVRTMSQQQETELRRLRQENELHAAWKQQQETDLQHLRREIQLSAVTQQRHDNELQRLRQELDALRRELAHKDREIEDRNLENERMRMEMEMVRMDPVGMYHHSARGPGMQ